MDESAESGFIKSNCIQQRPYRPHLSVANNKETKHKANNHASPLQYLPESRVPANKIETPGKGVCDRGLGSQSSILQSFLLLQRFRHRCLPFSSQMRSRPLETDLLLTYSG
jgi:hypothetical protein